MDELVIAVAQLRMVDGDVATNLAHYTDVLAELPQPTDLILLPEMFPTGYQIRTSILEPHLGSSVAWMHNLAARYDAMVGGTIGVTDAGKNYNRFYLVEPTGNVSYYDKQHLFAMAGEEKIFTAGNRRIVVNFRGWRIALQTCFDLRFPESARNCGDYDLLLYAASWPAVRDYAWRSLLVARAIENQTYIAAANRVGDDAKGHAYVGHSCILDAEGKACSELPDVAEGILTACISKKHLAILRTSFPVLPKSADQ
jgi:possible hydrolase